MEEGTNPQQSPINSGEVGFPQNSSGARPKSKTSLVIFIILAILLIAGGVVFFVSRGSEDSPELSPSPSSFQAIPSPIATPSPSAKPVDKSTIKIEVLNGTGIPGEAAYLQGVLKGMGFENVTAGNSQTSNETVTAITFATGTSKEVMDEIEKKLATLYKDVKTTTSSTLKTSNIKIVTGLRTGASPRPSATPTASTSPKPSASASATPKPSTSPTPTVSPTASSTPTPSPAN